MYLLSSILIATLMIYPLLLLNEYNGSSKLALSREKRLNILSFTFLMFLVLNNDGGSFELIMGYFVFFIPFVVLLSVLSIKNSETSLVMVDDNHVFCIKNKRFIMYLILIIVLFVTYFSISTLNNDEAISTHKNIMLELNESSNYVEDIIHLSENPNSLLNEERVIEMVVDGDSKVIYGTSFVKYIETTYDNGKKKHMYRFEYQRRNDEWRLIGLVNESYIIY